MDSSCLPKNSLRKRWEKKRGQKYWSFLLCLTHENVYMIRYIFARRGCETKCRRKWWKNKRMWVIYSCRYIDYAIYFSVLRIKRDEDWWILYRRVSISNFAFSPFASLSCIYIHRYTADKGKIFFFNWRIRPSQF